MMLKVTASLFFLFFYDVHDTLAACDNITSLSMQLDTLLAEYDRESPPSVPVHVAAYLNVRHVSIHEVASTVRVVADLHINWTDHRLTWNATEWGCSTALLSAERMWLPDITSLNAEASNTEDGPLRARISSDGFIYWVSRIDMRFPISIDLRDWPKDQQTGVLRFGSRAHNIDELVFSIGEDKHELVWEVGGWNLISVIGEESKWKTGIEVRSVISWKVLVQRRAAAHSLTTGIVLVTSLLLMGAACILPPNSRAPLCATAAFVSVIWLWWWAEGRGGATCPWVLRAVCAVCACAAAGASGAALVTRLARRSGAPPACLRTVLRAAARLCSLSPPSSGSSLENYTWAAAAQLLDYILLTLMGITLFIAVVLYFL